ncbi:MAG TPA: hypothetical protein ENI23_09175 [bacterium]|nr:hypothetical protein [bacterium]
MSVVTMEPKGYEIEPETAKMIYNWFHSSYPEWQTNKWCTSEEIRVMQDLEEFILKYEALEV